MNSRHQTWLCQLTGLATASGCEQRVIDWVLGWTKRRRGVTVRRDPHGNLLLGRKGRRKGKPILFAAHMDHPAFVVTGHQDRRTVEAVFRGGVEDRYFEGSRIGLWLDATTVVSGVVKKLHAQGPGGDRRVTIRLSQAPPKPVIGHVATWHTGGVRIRRDRLLAPACDDLAGVAAALSAFDALGNRCGDVRVLLTRAEEIGFIGAIGASASGIIPSGSRIIALECSKSFADSPIGGGPIARVGDRTSTFDPDLTRRLVAVAQQIGSKDPTFRSQRCLMPGGTCEATAYQAFGHTAACLCLPLGRYHNMNQETGKIDRELISLSDYHGLVRWLVAAGRRLDDPAVAAPLRQRLDRLFAARRSCL